MGAEKALLAIVIAALIALYSGYVPIDDLLSTDEEPSVPLDLVATAGIGVVSLSWDAPSSDGGSEITSYEIYASTDSDVTADDSDNVGNTASTSYTCSGLTSGTLYYFLVTAVNSVGEGPGATASATPINASGNLTMYVIDVGQGDSLLIQTPDAKNILIDSGSNSEYSALDSFLSSKSITTIDVLVATHPDEDHIGGLDDVLADYVVLSVYDSGFYKSTVTYANFRNAITAEGCPYYNDSDLDAGDILNWSAQVQFTLLHIDADASSANDASIVLKMSFGTVDFLLTGDAEEDVELEMVSLYDLDVEILKVGHHGSNSSSNATFLAEVTPTVALISVGEDNVYDHPSPFAEARIREAGGVIFRTDLNQTITVTTDGTSWDVIC